jgi:hypothetical protein
MCFGLHPIKEMRLALKIERDKESEFHAYICRECDKARAQTEEMEEAEP